MTNEEIKAEQKKEEILSSLAYSLGHVQGLLGRVLDSPELIAHFGERQIPMRELQALREMIRSLAGSYYS